MAESSSELIFPSPLESKRLKTCSSSPAQEAAVGGDAVISPEIDVGEEEVDSDLVRILRRNRDLILPISVFRFDS